MYIHLVAHLCSQVCIVSAFSADVSAEEVRLLAEASLLSPLNMLGQNLALWPPDFDSDARREEQHRQELARSDAFNLLLDCLQTLPSQQRR